MFERIKKQEEMLSKIYPGVDLERVHYNGEVIGWFKREKDYV